MGQAGRAPHRLGAAAVTGLAALAWVLAQLAARAVHLQWDLRVYLAAARAARVGLDPYVVANLAWASGRPETLPFLYPPVALLPFLGLSLLPATVAAWLWVALKLGLTAGLVAWWARAYAPRLGAPGVAALALFGANAALVADLRSGNVGLVEAGLLWGAFAAWMRGRATRCAALTAAAATFKLAPALFLALLLVPGPGRPARPRVALAALLALGALALAPLALGPASHWRGPLAGFGAPFPVGEANPSLFALVLSLARGRVAQPFLWAGATWALWAVALVVMSRPALARLAAAPDPRGLVAAAVTLDLLLSPRPMAYGFVLAGGALAWLVAETGRTRLERAGLVALLAAQGFLAWLSLPWRGTLASCGAFLALAGLWALYLARERTAALQSAIARAAVVEPAAPAAG